MGNYKESEEKIVLLLTDMFPYLKQYFLDVSNSKGGIGDLKDIILAIDKHLFLPPTTFDYKDIKFLEYTSFIKRDKKYSLFLESKVDKFFRKSYTDPKDLNLLTCTPITIDENHTIIEGKHRAYAAKKFKTPIRAVKVVKKENTHKNVQELISLSSIIYGKL